MCQRPQVRTHTHTTLSHTSTNWKVSLSQTHPRNSWYPQMFPISVYYSIAFKNIGHSEMFEKHCDETWRSDVWRLSPPRWKYSGLASCSLKCTHFPTQPPRARSFPTFQVQASPQPYLCMFSVCDCVCVCVLTLMCFPSSSGAWHSCPQRTSYRC